MVEHPEYLFPTPFRLSEDASQAVGLWPDSFFDQAARIKL